MARQYLALLDAGDRDRALTWAEDPHAALDDGLQLLDEARLGELAKLVTIAPAAVTIAPHGQLVLAGAALPSLDDTAAVEPLAELVRAAYDQADELAREAAHLHLQQLHTHLPAGAHTARAAIQDLIGALG